MRRVVCDSVSYVGSFTIASGALPYSENKPLSGSLSTSESDPTSGGPLFLTTFLSISWKFLSSLLIWLRHRHVIYATTPDAARYTQTEYSNVRVTFSYHGVV